MKTLAALLALLVPLVALAAPAPYPITVNSKAATAPQIELNRAETRTIRVSFTDGATASDLTGYTPWMAWYTNATAAGVSTARCVTVTATNGTVDCTFSAAALNYTPGRYLYGVGVSSGTVSAVYRQGVLLLRGSPYTAGAAAVAWTTNVNLATISWIGTFPMANMPSGLATDTELAGTNALLSARITTAMTVTASTVTCTGTYTNVQDALDALFYVAPSITALTGGGTYIKGQIVTNPAITWTVNKTMATRGISGVVTATLGAGGSGTYTDTGRNLATSGTYTLTVGDGTGTDSEGETFTFTNRRYVGASATTNQSNAEIVAMTATTQAKGSSGTTGALTAEYIVIAYPASLGACTAFSLGGFATTAWPSVTQAVTNAYGYAESYLVYRSENALTTGGIAYDIN